MVFGGPSPAEVVVPRLCARLATDRKVTNTWKVQIEDIAIDVIRPVACFPSPQPNPYQALLAFPFD